MMRYTKRWMKKNGRGDDKGEEERRKRGRRSGLEININRRWA